MSLVRLQRPVFHLLHRPLISPTTARKPFLRTVTNATKPDYIPKLLEVPRVASKPGNWHPTLVHSSGTCKFTVIRVPPGGEVPNHLHTKGWDYFMPLSGRGIITTTTKDGVVDWPMEPGSFLSVGPGDVHLVRNADRRDGSGGDEFVFFIVQSPRKEYDFVNVEEGKSDATEKEMEGALKGERVWQ